MSVPKDEGIQKWIRISVLVALLAGMAAWFYIAPPGLLGKLDAIGYAVCHRLDSHSLHMDGRQMPLCARCTGEFNAAAIALVFQAVMSPRHSLLPRRGILAVLVLFFLAFALDGTNSYLALMRNIEPGLLGGIPALYSTDSVTRVFTGSGMGLALASVLYPMYNQTAWQTQVLKPALDWRKFSGLVALLLIVDLAILTENPLILYPVALLSTMGVLALLAMVFSIVWIMVMRQDNTFQATRELLLPATAGLTLALIMIVAIDLARFSMTQTWGGFPGLQ